MPIPLPVIKPKCAGYSPKINIYQHPDFVSIPMYAPPPLPAVVYQPTGPCHQPYPTPTYSPPNPYCGPCVPK